MLTFWELPFGIRVEAPDSALVELERRAASLAVGAWDVEIDRECLHFRFETKESLVKFVVACVEYRTAAH